MELTDIKLSCRIRFEEPGDGEKGTYFHFTTMPKFFEIIKSKGILASDALLVNDPKEFLPIIKQNHEYEDKEFNALIKRHISLKTTLSIAQGWINKTKPENLVLTIDPKEVQKKFAEHFKFICFTTDCRNDRLWQDYADGEKGVALEFDLSSLKDHIYEIKYQDTPVFLDWLEDQLDEERFKKKGLEILTTKEYKWHHERESRFILPIGEKVAKFLIIENLCGRNYHLLPWGDYLKSVVVRNEETLEKIVTHFLYIYNLTPLIRKREDKKTA